jgi:hypothetical protein
MEIVKASVSVEYPQSLEQALADLALAELYPVIFEMETK